MAIKRLISHNLPILNNAQRSYRPLDSLRRGKYFSSPKQASFLIRPPCTHLKPYSTTAPSPSPSYNRLADKVAVVTGAASGMGRAIALAFAAEGTRLVVCADLRSRSIEVGEPTNEVICQRYGQNRALFVETDVGVAKDVEACVAQAVRQGGKLDIMVNNAGVGFENELVHQMRTETWDRMMRVNLRGVFLGCKHACAQFLDQSSDEKGHRGWIINMASAAGLTGYGGGTAAYCASKAGVVNFTKAVALDYAKHGIHCNALCPGYMKTPMTKDMYEDKDWNAKMVTDTPWGTLGDPADVARCAVFLASEDAAWVTGIPLSVDGGLVAH